MASTGLQFPTVVDGTWAGGNDWGTPDNVKLDDDLTAAWTGAKFPNTPAPGEGPELKTSGYGFAVPLDATITGIELKIKGRTDANRIGELVYLTVASNIHGNFLVDDWTDMSETATLNYHTYGSSADLWGATLTPAIVNNANFGWTFMIFDALAPLTSRIDIMQMNVHYTEAAVGGAPPIIMMIGA